MRHAVVPADVGQAQQRQRGELQGGGDEGAALLLLGAHHAGLDLQDEAREVPVTLHQQRHRLHPPGAQQTSSVTSTTVLFHTHLTETKHCQKHLQHPCSTSTWLPTNIVSSISNSYVQHAPPWWKTNIVSNINNSPVQHPPGAQQTSSATSTTVLFNIHLAPNKHRQQHQQQPCRSQ